MGSEAIQTEAGKSEQAGILLGRVAQLTRQLREGMRELGLDRQVAMAAEAIPDARDRLNYIAVATERAAERALNAIDRARPIQDELAAGANRLNELWACGSARAAAPNASGELVAQTVAYLQQVPGKARETNQQLLEIMMAQDFQDLTGQVIKKMMVVINEAESQLVKLLVDNVPVTTGTQDANQGLQNGPPVKPGTAVADQAQVDELLESLGF